MARSPWPDGHRLTVVFSPWPYGHRFTVVLAVGIGMFGGTRIRGEPWYAARGLTAIGSQLCSARGLTAIGSWLCFGLGFDLLVVRSFAERMATMGPVAWWQLTCHWGVSTLRGQVDRLCSL